MKICHSCDFFSKTSETFIYDTVCEVNRQGAKGHVLTFERRNEKSRPFPNVHVVPKPSPWNFGNIVGQFSARTGVGKFPLWPRHRARLETVLRRIEPAVLHAHFGTNGAIVRPIAENLSLPFVVTFYGADVSEKPLNPIWRSEYEKLWPVVDRVTALSEEMKGSLVEIGCPNRKIEVVHLSRNLENFPYQPPEGQVRTFLSVGRLTEKKGHLDAIRAVEEVSRRHPSVSLRIIGDGPLRESLESYVQKRNLESNVKLVGALPNQEVAREMGDADAFLLCSKEAEGGDREGTPTVLVEAQAKGLPCISTRHAGIPEMIPEENYHLLASEGDIQSIRNRIEELMSISERGLRSIARKGRYKVEKDFSLNKQSSRLIDIYNISKKI